MNSFWSNLPKSVQRRAARWFGRQLCRLQLKQPMISFSFDDFPRSALWNGGAILHGQGFAGTFYTSLGLMGQMAPTGLIFHRQDLHEVVRQGHELACHTFDHCDSWETKPTEFEASVLRNQQHLEKLLPGASFQSLSYPISWPRPKTKHRVAALYKCARGGGQTFNSGIADLNYLNAFFIEQSKGDIHAIHNVIDANVRACGWLIFATHDVCDSPTRFGCTPQFFKHVVNYAAQSGAAILPVNEALNRIGVLDATSVPGKASGRLKPSLV